MTPKLHLFLAAGLVLALPALAADMHDHASHGLAVADAASAMPLTEALVKKVDPAAGKVTLSHGPLPNGMPAMTMTFLLKDPAWGKQLKADQKVRFAAADVGGKMTVVRIEPVK